MAGERLVDGVVDHLVDEVVEAAGAGRADVHTRPQPDRLETLQNGDVLCGISGLSHEKSPANSHLAGVIKCIRNRGRSGPENGLGEARRGGSRDELAQLLVVDRRGERRGLGTVCGLDLAGLATRPPLRVRTPARGSVPAANSERRRRRVADLCAKLARMSAAIRPSSNAHVAEAAFTCSVPSRAMRAGQALRATVSPTAAGHARTMAAMSLSTGPSRLSSRWTWLSRRSISRPSPRRA